MMEANNTQPPPESTLKIPFYPIEFVGNVCKNSSEWTDTPVWCDTHLHGKFIIERWNPFHCFWSTALLDTKKLASFLKACKIRGLDPAQSCIEKYSPVPKEDVRFN